MAPPAVAKEVQASLDWLRVQTVANPSVVTALRTQMDEGEAEATCEADLFEIALALELSDVLLILDDKKARRVAQQMGMKVIGTVGMLLRAKRQGIIAEVKPLFVKLTEVNFRLSQGIIQEALRLSGED